MTTATRSAQALLVLTVLAASACQGGGDSRVETRIAEGRLADSNASRTVSMVRMINAVPGANGVDVSADDKALFSAVDYKSVTPYTELQDNIARFRIRGVERDTVLATNSEIMADGSRYTVIALAEGEGAMRLRVLLDEPASDTARSRLRVVHGIRGEGDVDVHVTGLDEALFDNLNFGAEAGYREIDPMKGTLVIRADGSGRELLRKEVKLVAGHSYTVVVAGGAATGGVRHIDAIIVDDRQIRN